MAHDREEVGFELVSLLQSIVDVLYMRSLALKPFVGRRQLHRPLFHLRQVSHFDFFAERAARTTSRRSTDSSPTWAVPTSR